MNFRAFPSKKSFKKQHGSWSLPRWLAGLHRADRWKSYNFLTGENPASGKVGTGLNSDVCDECWLKRPKNQFSRIPHHVPIWEKDWEVLFERIVWYRFRFQRIVSNWAWFDCPSALGDCSDLFLIVWTSFQQMHLLSIGSSFLSWLRCTALAL